MRKLRSTLMGLLKNGVAARFLGPSLLLYSSAKFLLIALFRFGFIRSPFVFQLITRLLSQGALSGLAVSADLFNPMWVDSDDL